MIPGRSRSLSARMSQRTGADFELVICSRLRELGCVEVEQVAVPWHKIRGVWTRGRKVSCDIKALIPPTGRAVHVEAKLRPEGTLSWSDLQDHQHRRLRNVVDAGGLAVIAFSNCRDGIELIDYAMALRLGFGAGAQFTAERRAQAAATDWPHKHRLLAPNPRPPAHH